MNKKGFTLVELLAVLVVLGIVVSITVPSITAILTNSKAKSEEAFVETIKDAMDIYISGNEKRTLNYNTPCGEYEMATIMFQEVIDSPYKPINTGSLVNPGNEKKCTKKIDKVVVDGKEKNVLKIPVYIYRNDNHVYYYSIKKSDFLIPATNDSCFEYTYDSSVNSKEHYISNLEKPEEFQCWQ